ncbi:hypothetical protein GCM10009608_49970 [Pseudonocardia alaniniphila]
MPCHRELDEFQQRIGISVDAKQPVVMRTARIGRATLPAGDQAERCVSDSGHRMLPAFSDIAAEAARFGAVIWSTLPVSGCTGVADGLKG